VDLVVLEGDVILVDVDLLRARPCLRRQRLRGRVPRRGCGGGLAQGDGRDWGGDSGAAAPVGSGAAAPCEVWRETGKNHEW
jgi:hypothetical protein